MKDDTQFQESVIEKVRESGESYEITHNGAWVIGCPKVEGLPAPKVGETIRTYGRGIGSTVRGIVVNGRVYRYQTEAEEKTAHEQRCREQEAEREQKFADSLPETDRRIAALPEMFRVRMEKFQRDGGHEFRRDYEGYELFCCEEAVKIATALKDRSEDVPAFAKLSWEQQKLIVDLDGGHSGNTFGMACRLAHWYLTRPENVAREHGALTPLVGCESYGCVHEVSPSSDAVAKADG